MQLNAIRERLRSLDDFDQRRWYVEPIRYDDGTVVRFSFQIEYAQPIDVEDCHFTRQFQYDVLIIARSKGIHAEKERSLLESGRWNFLYNRSYRFSYYPYSSGTF